MLSCNRTVKTVATGASSWYSSLSHCRAEPNLNTIADIGKERIRRVIAQMQAEREGQLPLDTRDTPEDLGFRVFKLAPSTFRQWEQPDKTPDALAQQLTYFDRGLEEGADQQHVLYEVILKEGYPLTSRIETLPRRHQPHLPRHGHAARGGPARFYLCLDAEVPHRHPRRPAAWTKRRLRSAWTAPSTTRRRSTWPSNACSRCCER